ncbi:hypothetical protein L7D48_01650 [Streptomyces sp. S1A]|uniref:hypothetical protein n=1 Tax=Streptomyces sp. ICN903 TaxID=2964654 RepID=UPI001EDB5F7D|nr:hypothetical protein [Streptomyces sp. ICN903]MCG3039286.1 hypothetical protein [Streptomyces sp. ICN903]
MTYGIEQPFTQLYQEAFVSRALDPELKLPKWQRLAFLALGRHERNGHAVFEPGELARYLGTSDSETGEVIPASAKVVDNAIRDAIKNDMLDPSSVAGCLIPPIDMVRANSGAGHYKTEYKPCPVHDVVSKAAKRARKASVVAARRRRSGAA